MPASSAGLSVHDALRRARRCRRPGRAARASCGQTLRASHAEVAVVDLPVVAQLARASARTASTGIAKPTPSPPPDCDLICALMPITRPSRVEQRPAGVAAVDGGVGLDRVADLELRQRLDVAVERGDHARSRATARSPNGLPIAATGLADADRVRLAERERRQRQALRVDLQQRDVRVRVDARRSRAGTRLPSANST